MSLRLTVLKYGDTVFGENYIFSGGDKEKLLPITFCFFLIESETRKILVDTGCDDGAGFPMSVFKTPLESLADIGITPDDITDIIVTHAHRDHIQSLCHFPKSRIYIQKDQRVFAKSFIPEGFDVVTFDNDYRIDEICVKMIGGHMTGSCIVTFEFGDKTVVLCGDECYTDRNLKEKIPTGASQNPENSKAFVEEYSKDKYIAFTCHDPDVIRGRTGAVRLIG